MFPLRCDRIPLTRCFHFKVCTRSVCVRKSDPRGLKEQQRELFMRGQYKIGRLTFVRPSYSFFPPLAYPVGGFSVPSTPFDIYKVPPQIIKTFLKFLDIYHDFCLFWPLSLYSILHLRHSTLGISSFIKFQTPPPSPLFLASSPILIRH